MSDVGRTRHRTRSPRRTSASTRCRPMKPAPPVTNTAVIVTTHLLTYSPTHLLTYSPTHLLTFSSHTHVPETMPTCRRASRQTDDCDSPAPPPPGGWKNNAVAAPSSGSPNWRLLHGP